MGEVYPVYYRLLSNNIFFTTLIIIKIMSEKRVYLFGNGKAEGKADMKNLLGGKGANLD